ncbi:c-type cytochrome biogenesis protein CcmI [Thioclava sp. FR2]|uniref:c-type cytochrome biogenesis protein CcmI n=1 Tax=Thioclava sp. FR2 TaxID=3445780 RepID=UPI003EB77EE4
MEDWGFLLAVTGLIAGVAATLIRAIYFAKGEEKTAADFDIAVYRDQLAEIERDIARGTLPAEEGQRLRTEVSRRLLDADRASEKTASMAVSSRDGLVVALFILLVIGGSVALYWRLGAPGYPDLPLADRLAMAEEMRANRFSQAEAEAKAPAEEPRTDVEPSFLDLMEKLRATMAERPDDLRGLELLARNEAALGNYKAAQSAQAQIVKVKAGQTEGGDHAILAELMILSAGGYVSPEAEAELVKALEREPTNGMARYYTGVMFAQVGRFDQTFAVWRPLLEESPADAPWVPPLRLQMPDIAGRAGVNYQLPPEPGQGLKGPTAGDVAAAGDMSEDDRKAMIEGMVAQLGERLANEGGSAEEWARLISSLAVLGRMDEAKEIYAEALTRFEGQTVETQGIRDAAVRAGVAE